MNGLLKFCGSWLAARAGFVLFSCLLLAWHGAVGAATFRVGGNFRISAGEGLHTAPTVAVNTAAGNFLAAWTSSAQVTATDASGASVTRTVNWVVARLVSATGAFLTEPVIVTQRFPADNTLGGSNPAIAYNAIDNEFLVVYERGYQGSTETGIFAQRVGPGGVLRGGEIALFLATGHTRPAIAHDSSVNRYLVAWNGLGNVNIIGGLLGHDGLPLGSLGSFALGFEGSRNPAIAYNSGLAEYMLVFETNLVGSSDIQGRLVDENGLMGVPLIVSAAVGAQTTPKVIAAADRFLASWTDGGSSVNAQLMNGDGTLSGSSIALLTNAVFPEIAYSNLRKRYLINWAVANPASSNNGFLQGRFLQANLATKSATFKISEASNVSGAPALAIHQPESLGLSVWSRKTGDSTATIWGQLIDVSTQFTTLSLVVSAPKSVSLGVPLTYTVRIRNNGSATGKGVSLSDTLPDGSALVSVNPSSGSCGQSGSTVSCSLGSLAAGATATVKLVVAHSKLGAGRNLAVLDWSNNAADPLRATTKAKVVYPGTLTLLAPDGGETLPSGSSSNVTWQLQGGIPGDVLSYRLQYSLNNGQSWKTAANGLPGTSHLWTVPSPAGNRPKALVRVTGFRDKAQIGSARSEKPFSIEVIGLSAPFAGETVNAGHVLNVAWNTHATKSPVGRVQLQYSLNGGKQWKKLAVVQGNPGSYAWTVPATGRISSRSKVRVILKGVSGASLGIATSSNFTILP